jgi:hypothetical protein
VTFDAFDWHLALIILHLLLALRPLASAQNQLH